MLTAREPMDVDGSGSDAAAERLAEVAISPSVDRAVEGARELLGMDVAYATQFTETDQIFEVVRGDGESFDIHEGLSMPLEQTYCKRVLAGDLSSVICDVRADPVAAGMPVTGSADVGAFVSVPVYFSDGTFHGTLCAANHEPRADIGDRERRFLEVFARMIADQIERERLLAAVRGTELKAASATALAAALDARDNYTGMHSRAVVDGASAVAVTLGYDAATVSDIEHVALLHDIGKIAIPDSILQKEGPLDEREWELMRQHPVHGSDLVATIAGLEHLAPAVRAEHERWDGKGYPDGLAGEAIPIASRIVFVCDAYHAMRSDRPYRRAIPQDRARAELAANLGTQFCPVAGAALLEALDSAS